MATRGYVGLGLFSRLQPRPARVDRQGLVLLALSPSKDGIHMSMKSCWQLPLPICLLQTAAAENER